MRPRRTRIQSQRRNYEGDKRNCSPELDKKQEQSHYKIEELLYSRKKTNPVLELTHALVVLQLVGKFHEEFTYESC